ncbi:MAG: dihydropteroate synthase [Deltaproteobacteria bacterium]|jgi:5-methyltetrahydrofolate--homocysteine methyltransferase|nr:dihydropteroate synthase [Deltaproteobacteria bacterium]MBW2486257.1 dihydropteroate synthase [Deltaproteobacteria bacterium]MBW2516946.1 dihydropteroate synthase [Deltaproteobacteria bacterium]
MTTTVESTSKKVSISRELPTAIIGERINPTGRKTLQQELKAGNFDTVKADALAQIEAGAVILDVNAGVPGADEPALLVKMVEVLSELTDVPLCIDTANVNALEAALKAYSGKALVNSVNGEEERLETVLPLIKQYNAAVIGLTMDDDGIPKTLEKRIEIAGKIIDRATKLGIAAEDIVIDPLAMSVGADDQAGKMALDAVEAIVKKFGVNITMGCSNISFGIPDRELLNGAFLAMAIRCGLTCPITNPLFYEVVTSILAADLAMGRDEFATNWIEGYRKRQAAAKK